MAKKAKRKFSSLIDAHTQARNGDELAQRCIIGCLHNFGCEGLAQKVCDDDPKWIQSWRGIQQYIMSLVGEYGEPEWKAEREVLAELNEAVNYADTVEL